MTVANSTALNTGNLLSKFQVLTHTLTHTHTHTHG